MTQEVDKPSAGELSFRLGEWLVEPRLNRLTRDGESIQIEPKVMDVLVCLAGHACELVERQALIDTVWATEYVSENILTRAIAELRHDKVEAPPYRGDQVTYLWHPEIDGIRSEARLRPVLARVGLEGVVPQRAPAER